MAHVRLHAVLDGVYAGFDFSPHALPNLRKIRFQFSWQKYLTHIVFLTAKRAGNTHFMSAIRFGKCPTLNFDFKII